MTTPLTAERGEVRYVGAATWREQMDRSARDRQYLPLRTAAAEVHIALFGVAPDALSPDVMRIALEGMARSLAPYVLICTMPDPSRLPVEIPRGELAGGSFTEGGATFVTKKGVEYRNLVVQRGEMNAGIALLRLAALKRAVELVGGKERLSVALQIELHELEAYLAGQKLPPPKTFSAAMDIVAEKKR